RGLGRARGERRDRTGAAHAVPLVAQASGGEAKRKTRIGLFRDRHIGARREASAAIEGRKHVIGIKPRTTRRLSLTTRPLLRTLRIESRVVETRNVEIAAARRRDVLGKNIRGLSIRKQRRLIGTQARFQA